MSMALKHMHLKNFSLITRDQLTTLSPAYDLLNTTIAQLSTKEELALPLQGRKNHLRRRDFIDYFAIDRLQLNTTVVTGVLEQIYGSLSHCKVCINTSFLSEQMKHNYLVLLAERWQRLFLEHIQV